MTACISGVASGQGFILSNVEELRELHSESLRDDPGRLEADRGLSVIDPVKRIGREGLPGLGGMRGREALR